MWAHRPNLMRAAFGGGSAFTPGTFGAQSLYNNSPGPHLLRVWAMLDSKGGIITLSTQQGRLTTHDVGNITPAVLGEPAPPGTIDQQSLGAIPPFNFAIPSVIVTPALVNATFPFVVLRPGWSLVATDNTVANPIGMCFWWDYVFPIELLKPDIGDPEIDG